MTRLRSQGLCEPTSTERFDVGPCACDTYPDNLGPCATFEEGRHVGHCVYCDHRAPCHELVAAGKTANWSAAQISWYLVRHTFNSGVLAVPNCTWPGSECDLLVVTRNLRIIDVEIKVSRADLKSDIKKDKWYTSAPALNGQRSRLTPRAWPQRVWKHYYCMPREVWKPEFVDVVPKMSGILLVREANGVLVAESWRRAKPDRSAERLGDEQVINIARLASLRMWDVMRQAELGAT